MKKEKKCNFDNIEERRRYFREYQRNHPAKMIVCDICGKSVREPSYERHCISSYHLLCIERKKNANEKI